ncbi:MAG: SRPBCC domain-containing protein [Planctomycetes bacterium]|nr:SRPBCC domain-containing protein [Planctomycetota bacterium]
MTGTPEIQMERSFKAAQARVFATLSNKASVALWLGPSDDYQVIVHDWDCRPQGRYRVQFDTPEGQTHIVIGEFREVSPDTRLSFTWTWEGQPVIDSLVTFELKPEGTGTHLLLTHTGFPDAGMRGHHEQGWAGTLERLSRAVG